MKKLHLKLFISVVLCCRSAFSAHAQSLPKVQETSVYAPADVKIDGKPTEWGKFQAYNKATQLFYTLSNDKENVYLAIQVTDQTVIKRILGGGLVLSIQQTDDKNDKNKASITYPAYDTPNAPVFSIFLSQATKMAMEDPITHTLTYTQLNIDTSAAARNITMNQHNNLIAQKLKWIGVSGVKDVDPLISIYNEDGIKVTGLFDNNVVYTLEMAVPLKYLNLSANNGSKFHYHLQVDGIRSRNGDLDGVPESVLQNPGIAQIIARQTATTDFWGEYQLADK